MEVVKALSLDWHTIVTWYFASWTWRLKGELTNGAALFCFDVPLPSCYCVPWVYFNLHWVTINSNNMILVNGLYNHFLVSLSVPSLNILYFSLAFSVRYLIFCSISLALAKSFSFAPVYSLMVSSFLFLRKLNKVCCTPCPTGHRWSDLLQFYQVVSWWVNFFWWSYWVWTVNSHIFWPFLLRSSFLFLFL